MYISSDGLSRLAISFGNRLQLIDNSSGSILLSYQNELQVLEDSNMKDERKPDFVCHAFSPGGVFLAALTDDKKVLVWKVKDATLECQCSLPKRPTCLDFCHQENTIVAADKYGDVFRYTFDETTNMKPPSLLLGHLSMVLTTKMSLNDKYIITADRDEKIRVSCYPNSYSIHSYCLGHTKLVSCLLLVSEDLLLSGSADGTLRLWNYMKGEELSQINIKEILKKEKGTSQDIDVKSQESFVVNNTLKANDYILVTGEGSTNLLLFSIENNKLNYITVKDVERTIYNIVNLKDIFLLATKNVDEPLLEVKIEEKDIIIIGPSSINTKIEKGPFSEPNFMTHLIKPIRGKRPNLITPEATINLESATKIQKSDKIAGQVLEE